jgi:hypothetical protein
LLETDFSLLGPTLRVAVYCTIHGPLMGLYSNTPRSLDYQRSGVQDWVRKKTSKCTTHT